MKWHWILTSLFLILFEDVSCSTEVALHESDNNSIASILQQRLRVAPVTVVQENKGVGLNDSNAEMPNATHTQSDISVVSTKTKRTLSPKPEDLKQCWQDYFYHCHNSGDQHILICTGNQDMFEQYMFALVRILDMDMIGHLSLTFVSPKTQIEEIRAPVLHELSKTVAFRKRQSKRDIHFFEDSSMINLISQGSAIPLDNKKYSAIMLAGTMKEYPVRWLLNQNSVFYIPCGERDRKVVMSQLVSPLFNERRVKEVPGMVCALTSDMPNYSGSIYPAHITEGYELELLKSYFAITSVGSGTVYTKPAIVSLGIGESGKPRYQIIAPQAYNGLELFFASAEITERLNTLFPSDFGMTHVSLGSKHPISMEITRKGGVPQPFSTRLKLKSPHEFRKGPVNCHVCYLEAINKSK
jgi:hypothetical protein